MLTTGVGFLVSILNGWVIKVLYDWFLLKTFCFPEITIFHAIGLTILIGHVTKQYIPIQIENKDRKKCQIELLTAGIIQAISALITGWIFHFFV